MKAVIYLAILLMVTATLLPFLHKKMWWVRGADFVRLQVLIISLALLGFFFLVDPFNGFWDFIFFALLLAVLFTQIVKIFPYTALGRKEVASGKASSAGISLITANIQKSNRHSDQCIDLLQNRDPDIVLFLEVDNWWLSKLKSLYDHYPHRVEYPMDNSYGMLLLSKYELICPEVKFLVSDDIPSIITDVKISNEHTIRLFCLHPAPPTPSDADDKRNSSAQRDAELLKVAKLCKIVDKPVIVLGDLNDVAWSRTTSQFQDISRLLDPRQGRGLFNSFHAQYFFLRFPLDHIFHSHHFKLLELKRLEAIGSDHFPIWIKLALGDK